MQTLNCKCSTFQLFWLKNEIQVENQVADSAAVLPCHSIGITTVRDAQQIAISQSNVQCCMASNLFARPLPTRCSFAYSTIFRGAIMEHDQPIVKNAVRCSICQSPADRYANRFQCQSNPCHVGDLFVGIFADLSPPSTIKATGPDCRQKVK